MKTQVNTFNGGLDWTPEYKSEFEYADLYPNEIDIMRVRAKRILAGLDTPPINLDKNKKQFEKLASHIIRLTLWIEREVWSHNEQQRNADFLRGESTRLGELQSQKKIQGNDIEFLK